MVIVVPVEVPTTEPFALLMTTYWVTPTLSVDAFHDKETWVAATFVVTRPTGVDGRSLSTTAPPTVTARLPVRHPSLPAASIARM